MSDVVFVQTHKDCLVTASNTILLKLLAFQILFLVPLLTKESFPFFYDFSLSQVYGFSLSFHNLFLGDKSQLRPNNIQKYGNTTAASIPIALCEAWEAGKIKEGDLVCLAAFGSGFTWGSALIRW